jgi:16S rRNA (uracil1498-N3)-methyltransferase
MSRAPLRLYTPASLASNAAIMLSPAQAHYLGTVMRRAAGDTVLVFNASDGEWRAGITALRRDRCDLVVECQTRPPAAEPTLRLLFALLKRDATDLVVQKATELGVTELQPVLTARTQASQVNLARLMAIAIEASEQSERLGVPVLHPPRRLDALLAAWPASDTLAVAAERVAAPPLQAGAATALLVGPEGGFAPEELDVLGRHAFVVPANLGPRILRAETASIVGLALLQAPVTGH